MSKRYAGSLYVVAASKDGKTEYWVAATSPNQATAAIQLKVGPEWSVQLTSRRLTPSQRAELALRPDEVRHLPALP